MGNGIPILDTVTRNCEVEQLSKFKFRIVLTQGLNRQIRRMCEYLGYDVVALKRVRIMNVSLDVPLGKWRYLTDEELNVINKDVDTSSKTEEASLQKQTMANTNQKRNIHHKTVNKKHTQRKRRDRKG